MSNAQANLMNGVGLLPANDKQQPHAAKKTALRDAHNPNLIDSVEISRKLMPENPSNFRSQLFFGKNTGNEHIVNARRRFELELGNGRSNSVEKYTDCRQPMQQQNPNKQTQLKGSSNIRVPVTIPTPPAKISYNGSSVPNHVKVSAEIPENTRCIKRRMTDRFIQLQQFLKQCDDSRHRGYLEMLLNLSPLEVSRHAVELEKKTTHLAIEEAKELERMNSLNILTQSASENPTQATQLSRK